nr:probable amidase At4g34880 [Ipomoea batatas]
MPGIPVLLKDSITVTKDKLKARSGGFVRVNPAMSEWSPFSVQLEHSGWVSCPRKLGRAWYVARLTLAPVYHWGTENPGLGIPYLCPAGTIIPVLASSPPLDSPLDLRVISSPPRQDYNRDEPPKISMGLEISWPGCQSLTNGIGRGRKEGNGSDGNTYHVMDTEKMMIDMNWMQWSAQITKRPDLTSLQLVDFYLERIQALNPLLRAVIEVNPDARAEAEKADKEREENSMNMMHGIPVLLKDSKYMYKGQAEHQWWIVRVAGVCGGEAEERGGCDFR